MFVVELSTAAVRDHVSDTPCLPHTPPPQSRCSTVVPHPQSRKRYNADYSKYEPLIVAHKTKPKMLFCTLTGIELNRIPGQVEAHINGKRFRNRKAEMEGLKQAERPSATPSSDDDEFWVSAVHS